MSESRSASLKLPQAAISRSVRPQPMHSPVMPLTAQILMQGVEIGAALMPLPWRADRDDAIGQRFHCLLVISIINKHVDHTGPLS